MEEQIRKLAKDFAENELRKRWEELDCKNPTLLKDILKKSANIGVFSFLIDEEIGGAGFSLKDYSIFLEEISKACAGISAVFASHLMGITPILLLKDKERRNRFLSTVIKSEKEGEPTIFTLAVKEEKFSKLVPDDIQTVIKQNERKYIVSGKKINVPCAEIASYFTLLVRKESDNKFTLLLVPSNCSGIEVKEEKQRMGLRIFPINDLVFNDVEVSEENVVIENIEPNDALNYYKFFDSPPGAVAVGIAEEALNITLKYTTERYQGGKIICEHDAVKMILSDMALSIEVAKNFVYNSSNIISSVYAGDIAEKVCIDAIQLLGGYGYMEDFKLERILRDAKTYQAILNPIERKMEYIDCEIRK